MGVLGSYEGVSVYSSADVEGTYEGVSVHCAVV